MKEISNINFPYRCLLPKINKNSELGNEYLIRGRSISTNLYEWLEDTIGSGSERGSYNHNTMVPNCSFWVAVKMPLDHEYHSELYFSNEEDILAFKLRWL